MEDLLGGNNLSTQTPDFLIAEFKGPEFLFEIRPDIRQPLHRAIMLSRRGPQGKKPLFGVFQIVGIKFQIAQGRLQGGNRLRRFIGGPVQAFNHRIKQPLVLPRHPAQAANDGPERRINAVFIQKALENLCQTVGHLFTLHHATALIGEGVLLTTGWRQLFKFF